MNKLRAFARTGGEEEPALTPPWGLLGLGYTMRNGYFTYNNFSTLFSKPHAVGQLAERLVEKGMLADAGEDDLRSDGDAGQQKPCGRWV